MIRFVISFLGPNRSILLLNWNQPSHLKYRIIFESKVSSKDNSDSNVKGAYENGSTNVVIGWFATSA
ncbi:Phenylalanine--tRNA ligase beta subunit [Dirofilaria immitis]